MVKTHLALYSTGPRWVEGLKQIRWEKGASNRLGKQFSPRMTSEVEPPEKPHPLGRDHSGWGPMSFLPSTIRFYPSVSSSSPGIIFLHVLQGCIARLSQWNHSLPHLFSCIWGLSGFLTMSIVEQSNCTSAVIKD